MAKPEAPVLTNEQARDRHDFQWRLYPYEHRSAYWLRAGQFGVVCTRCGGQLPAHAETHELDAFERLHLDCPLGHGLDGRGVEVHDPLFSEVGADAKDPAGPAAPAVDELFAEPDTKAPADVP